MDREFDTMNFLYLGELRPTLEYVKKKHGGVEQSFSTVEEFKEVMQLLNQAAIPSTLILSDISTLSFRMSYMLKFIDKYPGNTLVLVGSYDNILPTVLSRMSWVKKFGLKDVYTSKDVSQLKMNIFTDTQYIDNRNAMRTIAQYYPEFMPFYLKTQKVKARRSVLSLAMEVLK